MGGMDATSTRPELRTADALELAGVLANEIRRIGVREVARRTNIPPSTISDRLASGMTDCAFRELRAIVAGLGWGLQLVYTPPSPFEVTRRRVRRKPPQNPPAASVEQSEQQPPAL